MSHKKTIPGKDIGNDPNNPNDLSLISFKIQKNNSVAGFGMPITPRLCRKIICDHHRSQVEIYEALDQLEDSPETIKVKEKINPDKEITSGIYGRDSLMHILEQEGCEGIRYIACEYGGEKSIVLIGVDKNGKPIGGKDIYKKDLLEENPISYEVKGGGQTRAQVMEAINKVSPLEESLIDDKIIDSIL